MKLIDAIDSYLSEEVLAQLAQASAMRVEETRALTTQVVAALVKQLALPADLDELNARWDMCRQLYHSHLLTDADELLRTDIGWPDRRRHLAEKLLGAGQVAALTSRYAQPAAANTLLGYLTILVLAVLGKQADTTDLDPSGLADWLRVQSPLTVVHTAAASAGSATAASATANASKARAVPTGRYLKLASVAGGLALAGLGGYFLLGTPTNASAEGSRSLTVSQPVVTETPAVTAVAAVATTPAATPAVAKPAALPAAATKAAAKPTGAVLRDTLGNASMALFIGGHFNVAAGRYPKGDSQPLTIKLVDRVTLTVGINSTESLLYKRLAQPGLPRPSDVVVDRLSFDNSQANLGAEGAQQLGSIASLLKTFPKARLLVLGHANPGESDATKLGLKRATIAVEELQKQGIDASRLQAQGVLATGTPTDHDSPERQAMLQGISFKISRL